MTSTDRRKLIRSAHINQQPVSSRDVSNSTRKEISTMAQNPNQSRSTPSNKPAAQTKPTPANGTAPVADAAAKPKKEKRARIRFHSTKEPSYWVRAFKDVVDKYGAPKDPWGGTMEPKAFVGGFGLTPEQREQRKQAKEAEKARLAAMSDEEKLAYAKQKREASQAKKSAKKAKEREELIAQLKADIAAGKI